MKPEPLNVSLHAGGRADLVRLDPDHPGFRDPVYRARRNEIARIALEYETGDPVPEVAYTDEEHGVWREVWRHLGLLHERWACREYMAYARRLDFDRSRIPQLADLNPLLQRATGFEMEPVAGLVSARTFLEYLSRRIFLSTQYIRHPSTPLYTPEPDVVHELVGHAASLMHPGLADLNEALGRAALAAEDGTLVALERIYWYTLEFGAVEEEGEVKAFGAGLLSSFGELGRFGTEAELVPWDLDRMAATPYDPTDYQPLVFVGPSYREMVAELLAWLH
ncbi:MAG: phenylalanine 4-monooxygenase [Planctomycetota bacterium]|nr:phenylalanine 4-monooxygenase [Planctomycetota bacterium]